MQLQPRQQLLDIWQAISRHSFSDGRWAWGEDHEPNSVADAERLLCLLYPATEIREFRLDDPETTDPEVLTALRTLGGRSDIPVRLLEALTAYMRVHSDDDGWPTFAGGGYFRTADEEQKTTDEQAALAVTESYSLSVTLSLATLGFLKNFTSRPRRAEVTELADELRAAASLRLTGGMVGLLRSFAVSVFDADSARGQVLVRLAGQGGSPDRLVADRLRRTLRSVRATLRDRLAMGTDVQGNLDDDSQLFECGWAWGVVAGTAPVETTAPAGPQPEGVADPLPYLYFTVSALDGITDLFSERTLTMGLLTVEQQRLAEALRLRWEITQQYWSLLARFGEGRWPLEDIPWRTTGQELESEYFSLLVSAILVLDVQNRRTLDDDLTRMAGVMERLAERGRITGRLTIPDPAVALHSPGVKLPLTGSDRIGPLLEWTMRDFSAQLLKRTIQLSTLSRAIATRDRLLRLGEHCLDHLWRRRLRAGRGEQLWDDVGAVFPQAGARPGGTVSWSITERMVECMVAGRLLYQQPPLPSANLTSTAHALLSEAGQLFGRELMEPFAAADGTRSTALRSIEVTLRRARQIADVQPGTACALALGVLSDLDVMAVARRSASRRT